MRLGTSDADKLPRYCDSPHGACNARKPLLWSAVLLFLRWWTGRCVLVLSRRSQFVSDAGLRLSVRLGFSCSLPSVLEVTNDVQSIILRARKSHCWAGFRNKLWIPSLCVDSSRCFRRSWWNLWLMFHGEQMVPHRNRPDTSLHMHHHRWNHPDSFDRNGRKDEGLRSLRPRSESSGISTIRVMIYIIYYFITLILTTTLYLWIIVNYNESTEGIKEWILCSISFGHNCREKAQLHPRLQLLHVWTLLLEHQWIGRVLLLRYQRGSDPLLESNRQRTLQRHRDRDTNDDQVNQSQRQRWIIHQLSLFILLGKY